MLNVSIWQHDHVLAAILKFNLIKVRFFGILVLLTISFKITCSFTGFAITKGLLGFKLGRVYRLMIIKLRMDKER